MFRFIFFTYFHSVRVVFCVTYYYRLSYYTYTYKILYVRSSVIRPRSRLTFRKIKTRIVGCKTPRRCQEITAICRRFVVVHKHTSYTTPPSSWPTTHPRQTTPKVYVRIQKSEINKNRIPLQTYIIVYTHTRALYRHYTAYTNNARCTYNMRFTGHDHLLFLLFFSLLLFIYFTRKYYIKYKPAPVCST